MGVFAYNSKTNYGTMVHIVVADTREEADKFAYADFVWDCAEVEELDLTSKGIAYFAEPTG